MLSTRLVIGSIVLLIMITSVSGQILSPTARLSAEIPFSTIAIAIGQTEVIGDFTGIDGKNILETYAQDLPVDELLSYQYNIDIDELRLFPVFGPASLNKLTKITVIEIGDLDFSSFDDFLVFLDENIHTYTNVDIVLKEGFFIYGITQNTIKIDKRFTNALSGILSLPLSENETETFLTMVTEDSFTLAFSSNVTILFQPANNTETAVFSQQKELLWNGQNANILYIIEDASPTLQMNAQLYLLPIDTQSSHETISITISPSDSPFTDIPHLITSLQNIIGGFTDGDAIEYPLEGFETVLTTVGYIINGGLVLVNSSDELLIDDIPQQITNVAFLRGSSFIETIDPKDEVTTISGEFRLVFLGDHFYTIQAPTADNGVAIPWLIIILWISALGLFIFTRFYLKKQKEKDKDPIFPSPLYLLLHISILIITFVLVDREISFQFGVSALDVLFGQGVNLIFFIIIGVQMIMWVLGYFLLAIPLRLILSSILTYVGVDKKLGKRLTKYSSIPMIWVFTALYVKLFINIMLLYVGQILPVSLG
ncbi:MAG: hypothetical protein KKC68_06115 [Candidatus Thermoplasmatota archaeon]|nr:hypothetical protein [Candidatus Thermoplasmatota archaeon]MBU1941332.1 hypothetical protein [Candidatus Thermoplasmatota archaeon]